MASQGKILLDSLPFRHRSGVLGEILTDSRPFHWRFTSPPTLGFFRRKLTEDSPVPLPFDTSWKTRLICSRILDFLDSAPAPRTIKEKNDLLISHFLFNQLIWERYCHIISRFLNDQLIWEKFCRIISHFLNDQLIWEKNDLLSSHISQLSATSGINLVCYSPVTLHLAAKG